jgi:putative ABC transport system permease protein
LLSVFAGLAVLLSTVGIYGVVAYFVGQRTIELGVRVALGADRREIIAMVLRQSLGPVMLGLVLGMAVTIVLARFVQSLLFNVSALDPVMLIGAAGALCVIATLACAVPARRAAQVSPIHALQG